MKCSIVRFPNRLEHHTSEYCCILPHALFFSPYTISLLIMRCHIHKITRIHGIREVNAKENTFNHKFVGYLKHFSRTLPISIGYTRRVYVILATGFFLIMYWENGKPDLNFLEYITHTHTQIQRNERTICSIYTISVWWGTRTESHFISFALATATRVQFTVYIHLCCYFQALGPTNTPTNATEKFSIFILIEIYTRHVCLLRWKNDIEIKIVCWALIRLLTFGCSVCWKHRTWPQLQYSIQR